MLSVAAAALVLAQPTSSPTTFGPGHTAWIVATVGQSEFCPAGNVRMDLQAGRYEFTPRAPRISCSRPSLERPVRSGVLSGAPLARIRSAFLRVLEQGLAVDGCRIGGPDANIVIDNGGPRVLVLTIGRGTLKAPEYVGCWTPAAEDLHRVLDDAFPSPR